MVVIGEGCRPDNTLALFGLVIQKMNSLSLPYSGLKYSEHHYTVLAGENTSKGMDILLKPKKHKVGKFCSSCYNYT